MKSPRREGDGLSTIYNDPNQRFCKQCGCNLAEAVKASGRIYCTQCGAENTSDARFCGGCGAVLTSTQGDVQQAQTQREAMPQTMTSDQPVESMRSTKKKKSFFLLGAALITVVVIVAGIFVLSGIGSKKDGAITYLMYNGQLLYLSTPSANTAVQLSTFVSSEISYYYNHDEDCVFYSDDGKILYYFAPSEGYHDDGGCPLYYVSLEDINGTEILPTMIDEYAIMNRVETSYVMETLDNGRLIYMGGDFVRQCYALKYFDGVSSSVLIEGDEIYVAFNSEKTLANICVYSKTGETNRWTWYRMTINGSPALEYVCDGTLSPMDDLDSEQDFQTMVENDIIICFSNYQDEKGYYSVDLYVSGQWRETLIEKLPMYSIGPFGITVASDISFFIISTVDLETTVDQYKGDSELWTFYQYKNGALREISEDLRLQKRSPDNAVLLKSIYCVSDEVLFRYNSNYADSDDDAWVSFKENGEIKVFNSGLSSIWSGVVLTNSNEEQILVYYGSDGGGSYPLYAYSDGTLKKLIDNVSDIEIYERSGEKLLVAYDSQTIYSIKASDMEISTIENDFSIVTMQERLYDVRPYSDNGFLCIDTDENRDLLYWNGKKSETIWSGVSTVWSDWQRVIPNIPRIY